MGHLKSSLVSAITLCTSLHAWGPHSPFKDITTYEAAGLTGHFPLNLDQQWYLKGEYLLWRPHQEDVDYGNLLQFSQSVIIGATSIQTDDYIKYSVKKPNFEWSSGVRIALGRYLPNHQQWDISAIATYYYNNAERDTKANFEHGIFFEPQWDPQELGQSSNSSVYLRLNFFTWDLIAGRHYLLTPTFDIHPFIGLRAALIEQKYYNRNLSSFLDHFGGPVPEVKLLKAKFRAYNEFWGVGPRVGTDLSYAFGKGWSVLGSLSASFLYGHYKIHQQLRGAIPDDDYRTSPDLLMNLKDSDPVLRSNLEASFGLGWEKWVRKHSIRIAPSLIVEAAEWFSMNHWVSTHVPSFPLGFPFDFQVVTRRHYGNLAYVGFNFNLQIDF